MSEKTLEFVKMIAAGENVQAEAAFDAMMLARVGSRVEQEKPTVAASMFAVEESEQIDELSKKTLGAYVKKASANAVDNAHGAGYHDRAAAVVKNSDSDDKKMIAGFDRRHSAKKWDKASKRSAGINKAVDKLTKEEAILEDDMDLWAPDKKKKKKKKHGLGGGDGKIWDTKKPKPSAIGGGSDRKIWEK